MNTTNDTTLLPQIERALEALLTRSLNKLEAETDPLNDHPLNSTVSTLRNCHRLLMRGKLETLEKNNRRTNVMRYWLPKSEYKKAHQILEQMGKRPLSHQRRLTSKR